MKYKVNPFKLSVNVTGVAYLHYFEFTNEYFTLEDKHDFCEIVYVDKGSIVVHAENYSGELRDNQLIIHRPNEVHSLECIQSTAPSVIIIGFECLSGSISTFSSLPFTLSQEHKKMLSDIMKEGMSYFAPPYDLPNTTEMKVRENVPFAADQLLKLRLEMFLITLVQDRIKLVNSEDRDGADSHNFGEIQKYIHEHYTEKISLDNICFLFGTNKTTLCSSFKKQFGTTVLNYVNTLRIKDAKAYLRKKELTVTQISEKLGFNSIHYFCRVFKKTVGQSPKEYMKTIRSKLEI